MITTDRSRWIALYVLCRGMLMIVLDVTVVNVAGSTPCAVHPGFHRWQLPSWAAC
ncbi:MAG: hypothetical protein M3N95_08000 [Actinomycetota bacterium]|nr:hypothetical protein [Actinomycetota bacterium]